MTANLVTRGLGHIVSGPQGSLLVTAGLGNITAQIIPGTPGPTLPFVDPGEFELPVHAPGMFVPLGEREFTVATYSPEFVVPFQEIEFRMHGASHGFEVGSQEEFSVDAQPHEFVPDGDAELEVGGDAMLLLEADPELEEPD